MAITFGSQAPAYGTHPCARKYVCAYVLLIMRRTYVENWRVVCRRLHREI